MWHATRCNISNISRHCSRYLYIMDGRLSACIVFIIAITITVVAMLRSRSCFGLYGLLWTGWIELLCRRHTKVSSCIPANGARDCVSLSSSLHSQNTRCAKCWQIRLRTQIRRNVWGLRTVCDKKLRPAGDIFSAILSLASYTCDLSISHL